MEPNNAPEKSGLLPESPVEETRADLDTALETQDFFITAMQAALVEDRCSPEDARKYFSGMDRESARNIITIGETFRPSPSFDLFIANLSRFSGLELEDALALIRLDYGEEVLANLSSFRTLNSDELFQIFDELLHTQDVTLFRLTLVSNLEKLPILTPEIGTLIWETGDPSLISLVRENLEKFGFSQKTYDQMIVDTSLTKGNQD